MYEASALVAEPELDPGPHNLRPFWFLEPFESFPSEVWEISFSRMRHGRHGRHLMGDKQAALVHIASHSQWSPGPGFRHSQPLEWNLIWVVYINPPKVQLLKHVSSVVWPKRFPPLVKLSFWWMNNLNTQFNHPSQLKMIVSSPLFIIPPVNKRKMNKPSRCTYINATQNLFALYLCDLDQVSTFIIFYLNR